MATVPTIQYKRGTQDKYNALSVYDPNTLYVLRDSHRIYLGEDEVTSDVTVVTNYEGQAGGVSADDAFEGRLYININTLEVRVKDSDSWVSLIPGYINVGEDVANEANDGKIATVKALREYVAATLAELGDTNTFVTGLAWVKETGEGDGKLVVTKGEETVDVILEGVPFEINYNEATYKLTISSYGSDTVKEIQLPKPGGIKAGRYEPEYTLPDGSTGPALVLTITNEDGESEVVIPAEELLTTYSGGETDTIEITVSAGNVITGSVKIDPAQGNYLVKTANGLKVDVSDKLNAYAAGEASELLLSDANGETVVRSGKTILSGTEMGEDVNVIPTAAAVAAAISAAIATINGEITELKTRVATIENTLASKIDIMGEGNADEVVISTAEGSVSRSAKVIGGAVLESNTSADVLATEAAVAAAMNKAVEDSTPVWGDL